MNIRGSSANLVQAVKELSGDWHQTQAYWRDVKSHEFEKNYLQDLPSYVVRATAVMEEIDLVLRKVKSDCE